MRTTDADIRRWLPLLAAQVLPDGEAPGASACAVDAYLASLFAGPRAPELRHVVGGMLAGLSNAGWNAGAFQALPQVEARHLIQSLLDAEPALWHRSWRPFVGLCIEGWLCDPRQGGNRNGLGWRTVGMAGPE